MLKMNLYNFNHDENFPFFIQFGKHEGELYMHSHENFTELVIVTDGTAEHIVDNEQYRIRKGDVFVISNDTAHGFSNARNFRLCNIMFLPSFWDNSDYDITKTAGFQALFVLEPHYSRQSHFCSRLKLDVDEFVEIFGICEQMQQEYINKKDGWKTFFISNFLRLTSKLSRLYSFDNIDTDDEMINLAKSIAYIENNFTQDISINHMAELSNYSQRQFLRVFRQTYGCKPTAYIRQLRIKKACQLLKSYSMSITEIALKCGYCDSNYFSRIFRTETGYTPSEYRKLGNLWE